MWIVHAPRSPRGSDWAPSELLSFKCLLMRPLTPETQPCTAQVSSKHCRILRPTSKEMVEQHAALVRAQDTAPRYGVLGFPPLSTASRLDSAAGAG